MVKGLVHKSTFTSVPEALRAQRMGTVVRLQVLQLELPKEPGKGMRIALKLLPD
jgi:hypothetical protein